MAALPASARNRLGTENEPWLLTEVRQFSSVRDQARFVEAFLQQLPLSSAPEAEFLRFYEALPGLVALVFGLGVGDARSSWLELGGPFAEALLAPGGALLRALESHRAVATLSYAFPLARLPAQLRAVWAALLAGPPSPQPPGPVPALWRRKAQQARARSPPVVTGAATTDGAGSSLTLDVFEYYWFCFCYYALAAGSQGSSTGVPPPPAASAPPPPTSVAAVPLPATGATPIRVDPYVLFLTLLRRYLAHYLARPGLLADDVFAVLVYFLVPPPLEPLSLRVLQGTGLGSPAALLAPAPVVSQPGLLGLQALQTILASAGVALEPTGLHAALQALSGNGPVSPLAPAAWFPLHELCWPGTAAVLQLVAARAASLPAAEVTQAVRCWRELAAPWLMLPVGHAHADEARWLGFVWSYTPLYTTLVEQLVTGVHAGLHPPASAAHSELVLRLLQPLSAPLVRALQLAEAALLRLPAPPPPPASPGQPPLLGPPGPATALGPFVAARLAQLAGPAGPATYEPLVVRTDAAAVRPLAAQLLRFYRHEAPVRDALALLFGLVLPAALAVAPGTGAMLAAAARRPRGASPERDGSGQLTPQGRTQVARGLRKCSALHVRPLGAPAERPAGSHESLLLVRLTRSLAQLLTRATGRRVQLRPLAAYATHLVLLVVAAAVWLTVRLIRFVALLDAE